MRTLTSLVAVATLAASGSVLAQSAKFAAVWSEDPVAIEATACDTTEAGLCGSLAVQDANAGYTMAQIRVPQSKELLVGVSAQVGLFTSTEVKGKRGSLSQALAAAGVVALTGALMYAALRASGWWRELPTALRDLESLALGSDVEGE